VHALELARTYLTPSTFLVLLSDGRANVSLRGGDPWHEALESARGFNCRALVVDTEDPNSAVRRVSELADALGASSINLASLEQLDLMEIERSTAEMG
jgi:magnesium chelatase subunit D